MHRERIYDSWGSKSKMENCCVTFVLCIDYIEKMENLCIKSYSPLFFSSPKSIKFELSALLPFRKYIVFSTYIVVYIRRFIYKFLNVCPFDYTAVAVSGKVGP